MRPSGHVCGALEVRSFRLATLLPQPLRPRLRQQVVGQSLGLAGKKGLQAWLARHLAGSHDQRTRSARPRAARW